LGEIVTVEGVDVLREDAALRVTVKYVLRQTQERQTVEVVRTI
jgi:hypothetical protein